MSQPPFAVLHVCMGNICRSAMAERLFNLALRRQIGDLAGEWYLSHGAGTGSWHVGEAMSPAAARQISARGGDPTGFRARHLRPDMIDSSDLILCATTDQVTHLLAMRPDAQGRAFVLGEFGRLLATMGPVELPTGSDGHTAYARGGALVAAVDAARAGQAARAEDNLDDPWGLSEREFARVADEIEATINPLAALLTGSR